MRRFAGWGLAAVLAAAALTGVTLAQADKVQGTATVGATKVSLTSGMAVGYTAPNGQLVSVLLSDKPADRKEFATDTKTGPGDTFSIGGDEYVVEVKSTSPRLVGSIKTKTPVVDTGATKAGLEATFDLAVEARK